MADYLIQEETLTNIANEIRELTGVEQEMSPVAMKNFLDVVNEDVDTQGDLIESIKSALVGKSIPEEEQGVDTSDATAAAADIMLGKSAYVAEGKVTGTFTIDSELNTQDSLISQIIDVANNLPDAGSGSNSIATCDVTLRANSLPIAFYYTTCFTEAKGIFPLTPATQGVANNTIVKNVVCGSIIVLRTAVPIIFNYTVTGGAALIKQDSQFCFFSIPQQPTGTVTITVIEED